jgi:hypothetical protein
MDQQTYVYFIQEGPQGNIKIGMSNDPIARMQSIQRSHARQLELLGVIEGGLNLEKRLHKQFKDNWVRYEWFEPVSHLVDFIDENASLNGCKSQLTQLRKKRARVATKRLNGNSRRRKEPKPKPRPTTITSIREHIKREEWFWWKEPEEAKPLEGVYHIKKSELFSKRHHRFYFTIEHTHDFYGELWVCVEPIKKNGMPTSKTDRAIMGRRWYPFDVLEWFTDHIDPPELKPKYIPKAKQNSLTIEEAKRALHLLDEGLTQIEIANQLGVCQNYISSLKLGRIKRYRHLVTNPNPTTRKRATLTEPIILKIIDRLAGGESQGFIAKDLGIAQCTVSHIYTGRTWKHLPRPWQ